MTPLTAPLRQRRAPAGAAAADGVPPASLPALETALSSARPPPASQGASSTAFLGSQVGGKSVISYSYTDEPWKLLAYDVYHFFRLAWALPYVVWPVVPADSGALSELAPTPANLWCVAVHAVLAVAQLAFLVGFVPAALLLPVWVAALLAAACLAANYLACLVLLNGVDGKIEFHSRAECAPPRPEHAHEQWVFLNGVAVGQHWMQSNLDRLALTFKRPILGIHNKTAGVLFDVIECLVQRNFTYATRDVRVCYSILKEKLYRTDITKVVFILHSQGGIEGGLVLDWLLQELPQDLLSKLEVYTFGNAANHCNNPHRTVGAQRRHIAAFGAAFTEPATTATVNGSRAPLLAAESSAREPAALHGQALGHIEHYAHTSDFVALWGVLHFVSSVPRTKTMPRFLGRVFARTSPRGGHQFCQHYLDGMFPLARADAAAGAFLGCAETGNAFMESDIVVGRDGDESALVNEAFERSWLAILAGQDAGQGPAAAPGGASVARRAVDVEVHTSSPLFTREPSLARPVKVKDVSRLWQYRNGRSPDDGYLRDLRRQATV